MTATDNQPSPLRQVPPLVVVEPVPVPVSPEAAFLQELIDFLRHDILGSIRSLKDDIPAFFRAADNVDLEGRCVRLVAHFERLRVSPSIGLFVSDLDKFDVLFQDLDRFLTTVQTENVNSSSSPSSALWNQWLLTRGGKFEKQLARLNNRINDTIVDHILNVSVNIPEREVNEEANFPPTIESMKLSKPSNNHIVDEEQEALWLNLNNNNNHNHHQWNQSLNKLNNLNHCMQTLVKQAAAVAAATCTTTSTSTSHQRRQRISQDDTSSTTSMDDSSSTCTSVMSNVSVRRSNNIDNHDSDNDDDDNDLLLMDLSSTSILRCGVPRLHWDFSPGPSQLDKKKPSVLFASSSNFAKTRKDRIELYIKTQVLRDMPQDTQVKELRVVLSQLEPGDTSPGIMAGKAVLMSIGTLGALLVAPLIPKDDDDDDPGDRNEALTQTPLEAAAVFSHYLMEFELEDGTLGTLERCNEDVYLYAGRSSRPHQHIVSRIPMIPRHHHHASNAASLGYGSPDSLTEPLYLRDLIRFRNDERQDKYNLLNNNCKHFIKKALSSGRLFPQANNLDEDSLDAFFAVCQGCYVQGDSFSIFYDYEEDEEEQDDQEADEEQDSMALFSDFSPLDGMIGGLWLDQHPPTTMTMTTTERLATTKIL